MQRSGARLFPMLITIVIIVLVIVAIVSIGRAIFGGDDTPSTETDVDKGRTALLKTSIGRSVSLTVRGPIVAQEEFKSYQVEISPDSRTMTIYTGYLERVDKSKDLSNNTPAYEEFVYALDKANMMKGEEPVDDEDNDLRGICAGGYVYEYAVLLYEDTVKRLWTSTCDGSKGTLDASTEQLNDLFLDQIPESRELIPFKSSGIPRLQF